MRYHLIPISMAIFKKIKEKKIASIGEDMKKLEPFCTIGRNIRWCRTVRRLLKKLNVELSFYPEISLLEYLSKIIEKRILKRYLDSQVYSQEPSG